MSDVELTDEEIDKRNEQIDLLYDEWSEAWDWIRDIRARFADLGVEPCE